MDQFHVEPAELKQYSQYMRNLATAFDTIAKFTRGEGCNVMGFIGLLGVLVPAVNVVGEVYTAALHLAKDRLEGSADGLRASAEDYENTDAANAALADSTIIPQMPESVGEN